MAKSFVATLGVGRGTWGHVARLIADEEWDKIIIISNDWARENFSPAKECDWILVNNRAGFEILKDEIKKGLPDGEIVISLASGNGKEHMALIAALKEKNQQFEIVTLTGNGVKFY